MATIYRNADGDPYIVEECRDCGKRSLRVYTDMTSCRACGRAYYAEPWDVTMTTEQFVQAHAR